MNKKVLASVCALLFFNIIILGQQRSISGVVTGDDGMGLPGATVLLKGTTTGVVTDLDGNYTIEGDIDESSMLLFSYVGYVTQEITVGDHSVINVNLRLEQQLLDEVVVVGYGVTKKSLVTGAIDKVDGEELNQTNNLRVEQALQGKVSGVSIAQNSGSPGAGMTLRVRGVGSNYISSPLFVVDGIKVGGIEDLNPNDIQSIEILKDAASAAIYGSEAANGVILISTKKGTEGKGAASYNAYYGINSPTNMPSVLNSEDYVKYFKEAYLHERAYSRWHSHGEITPYNDPAILAYVEANMPYNEDTVGEGTDWLGEIIKPAAVQSHHLSFTGGNEQSSYYISSSYYDEDGIIGGDKGNFKRYTVDVNGIHKVSEWLQVDAKLNYVYRKRHNINENDEFGGVVAMAANIDPLTPLYVDDPSELPPITDEDLALVPMHGDQYYGLSHRVTNEIANPVAWMDITHYTWKANKILGHVGAKASAWGFTYNPSINFENWNGTWEDWKPAYYFHGLKKDDKSYILREAKNGLKVFFDQYLDYNKTIGDHMIGVMVGQSFEQYKEVQLGATNKMLLYENENFAFLNVAQQPDSIIPKPWDGVTNEFVMISYFGRLIYNYQEKILLTANFRADGSNKFGANNRFGYFPSVSAGYVISREDFWNVPTISFLKLRGSWGRNGSTSNLGSFDWTSTITFERNRYPFGSTIVNGARPERSSNPDLRWENSEQLDIGIDAGFLHNRIFLTADYFNKTTIDLIVEGTPPLYTGNVAPRVNAGNIRNSGFEFDLGINDRIGDFKYSASINASYVKNEVIKLTDEIKELIGASVGVGQGNVNKFGEGYPAWYFWGYKTDGVFHNTEEIENYVNEDGDLLQQNAIPGDVRFIDINGVDSLGDLTGMPDGIIDENDRTYLGQPYPKWIFGLNLNLEFKGFDFAMLWHAVIGNSVYNGMYRFDLAANNKPQRFYDERWDYSQPENDNGWFRPTLQDGNRNFRPSDFFVEDGSYLKLRQLMIGYTIPVKVTSLVKISSLRLYFSTDNLLTITKYTGGDPEIGQINDNWAADVAIDRGFYPSARSYKFGVNVNF